MPKKELSPEIIESIITLYLNGDASDALNKTKNLIIDYPNEAKLFNLSGVCYEAIGELNDAVQSYKRATIINPNYVEAHYNLGGALQNLYKFNEAVKSYKKTIALKPTYAEAFNNLAGVFLEMNQFADAVNNYKKAIALKPDYFESHFSLGISYQELGKLNDAIDHMEKTIELKPKFTEGHNILGKLFLKLKQTETAIYYFNKTILLEPGFAEAHNNLGVVQQELGQLDHAVQSYEKALSIKLEVMTLNNLGSAYQQLGKIDDAVESYEKAISINPDYAESYQNISYLKKFKEDDSQVIQMLSLLSSSVLNKIDRSHLCFALAKVYENLGKNTDFFKFLNEGNLLLKEELNYSLDSSLEAISTIKNIFKTPPPTYKESNLSHLSNSRPIFIIGMPRSGTTLVEQIISSHNKVHGAGELDKLTSLVKPVIKNFSTGNVKYIPKKTIPFIRQEYLDMLTNLNVPENIITDKFPLNFQYVGFILSAFPDAKIVHLKRDPIATCWSNYNCSFKSGDNGYSYNLDDTIKFYKSYSELMNYWHNLYPSKIYDICYEDLTINQEVETRKLLKYCELDWDENCLNFHTNKRAVHTASAVQVRKPMYQGSSDEWKKYESYLQPLVQEFDS